MRTDYFATPVYKFDIVYDNDKLENWIRGINKNVSKNIHGGFQSFEKETMEYQLPYNFADLESMLQEKINIVHRISFGHQKIQIQQRKILLYLYLFHSCMAMHQDLPTY